MSGEWSNRLPSNQVGRMEDQQFMQRLVLRVWLWKERIKRDMLERSVYCTLNVSYGVFKNGRALNPLLMHSIV